MVLVRSTLSARGGTVSPTFKFSGLVLPHFYLQLQHDYVAHVRYRGPLSRVLQLIRWRDSFLALMTTGLTLPPASVVDGHRVDKLPCSCCHMTDE